MLVSNSGENVNFYYFNSKKFLIIKNVAKLICKFVCTFELPSEQLLDNGSLITNVESVYPTLTYPAHATIMTELYPKNHGIINNALNKFSDLNPDWYLYRKYIKGKTLYDLAVHIEFTYIENVTIRK